MFSLIGNPPIWTSDSHFCHNNIIQYCDRPFKNSSHMDEMMIRSWNEQVAPDQWVIHLGDFSFEPERYLNRLNGKILLVAGNHDHRKNYDLFDCVVQNLPLKVGEFNCFLNHRPLVVEEKRRKDPEPDLSILNHYDYIIAGHVHEKWKLNGKNVNIGVDAWGGKMLTCDDLVRFLRRVHSEKIEYMEAERWI